MWRPGRGKLAAVRVVRTELGEPDATGRRQPIKVPGTETLLQADLVIEAIGQSVPENVKRALPGLTFTGDGLVQTAAPGSFATGLDRVVAAGDLVNGGSTAVQGVFEGMQAAEEIDRILHKPRGL